MENTIIVNEGTTTKFFDRNAIIGLVAGIIWSGLSFAGWQCAPGSSLFCAFSHVILRHSFTVLAGIFVWAGGALFFGSLLVTLILHGIAGLYIGKFIGISFQKKGIRLVIVSILALLFLASFANSLVKEMSRFNRISSYLETRQETIKKILAGDIINTSEECKETGSTFGSSCYVLYAIKQKK